VPVALIAAVVGGAVASAVGAGILGYVAGAMASYAINAAFARKPSAPDIATPDLADRSQTITGSGSAVARQLVYGEDVKGGTIVFRHTTNETGEDIASEYATVPLSAPFTVNAAHGSDAFEDIGADLQDYGYEPRRDENGNIRRDEDGNVRYSDQEVFVYLPAVHSFAAGVYTFDPAYAGRTVRIQYRYRTVTKAHNRLHMVIVLAAHECDSIGEVYFDDIVVPISADGRVTEGQYANHAYIEKHLGSVGQSASAVLMAKAPDKWTADHRLAGHCYLYVELVRNAQVFANGVPNIKARVRGKRVYDPVTGVKAWSANAALCVIDYVCDPIYGLRATLDEIDQGVLIAARNICAETVVTTSGAEPRYLCNGVVDTNQTPLDVIEKLLTSLSGRLVYTGGLWRIRAGAYIAPTRTLTESDLRGPVSVKPRLSMQDMFNGVKGVYISPVNNWQPSDFPPVTNASYLAEDGGERSWFEMDLPFTTSPTMAQRIAKIELERVRQQQTMVAQWKLKAYRNEPPETVNVTNSILGWDAKPFEIVESALLVDQDEQGAPVIVVEQMLRETGAGIYAWNSGEETVGDLAPDTRLPSPFMVRAPGRPQVSEELYTTLGSTGVRSKAVIRWAASPDGQARRYDVQWRAREAIPWNMHAGISGTSDEILDLAPGYYIFQVRAINAIGVASPWAQTETEIVGLLAPPSDVTGFVVQSYSGMARFVWNKHPDLDVRLGGRISVRWSPLLSGADWNKGVLVNQDGYGGDSTTGYGPLQTGTYMAKAVDSTGHTSLNAATFVATEALTTGFSTLDSATYDPLFDGVRTNTVATDSALQLTNGGTWDETPGLIDTWAAIDFLSGIAPSGSCVLTEKLDIGRESDVRLFVTIDSAGFDTGDLWDSRVDPLDSWGLVDGSVVEDAECMLMVRACPGNPLDDAPVWGPWQNLGLVGDFHGRGFDFRVDFTSASATHNRRVTALRIAAKVPAGSPQDPLHPVLYHGSELLLHGGDMMVALT
jgi:Putative phage tail protein